MNHEIKKKYIFDFLKSESIIIEIDVTSEIKILEPKNNGTNKLQVVNLTTLNNTSKYWQLNPETTTFLQPRGSKVESIIIEETDSNILNIILIEMKSKNKQDQTETKINKKFKISLSWVYLLLNLLNHDRSQSIKVFGILVSQIDRKWNKRDNLNILSSTSIRYKKKSFYTTNTSIDIPINNLLS